MKSNLLRTLFVGAVLMGCSDSYLVETVVYGESRAIEPGVLRIYYGGGLTAPEIGRVDLRPVDDGAAEVHVLVEGGGDQEGAGGVYCVDVTVPDDLQPRRLLDTAGDRLMPWGDGVTSGAALPGGCARATGRMVQQFEEPASDGTYRP